VEQTYYLADSGHGDWPDCRSTTQRKVQVGYYPIFVEMQGRPVLLVGGGRVALEKVGKLVAAGARVTVIAPALIDEVHAFVENNHAEWHPRPFAPGDTAGFDMVMVATDDGAVNKAVADEARAAGIWVNAADDLHNCDFILPSLAARGHIAIAISTGGTSPALARWLRSRMEEFLSEDVGQQVTCWPTCDWRFGSATVSVPRRATARSHPRPCSARTAPTGFIRTAGKTRSVMTS
jgi:precorrin-2 dehydrogenase / sirohydrochlorin ferrochelatase